MSNYTSHYDDPVFFENYAQMGRSQHGLSAAGEWPTLQAMLPDFSGKRVLDMGCGYGWHCEYAAQHGASHVLGIDLSERMLAEARANHAHPNIEYRCAAIEDIALPDSCVDVIISSLALHYVEDFSAVARNAARMLVPGGVFIFSVEHPIFTAEGAQDWIYAPDGSISHFPVDNYFYEGARKAVFLSETIRKYHRTLTTYIGDLLRAGFIITDVREPQPPAHLLDLPGMRDEFRRPMMLILAAAVPPSTFASRSYPTEY